MSFETLVWSLHLGMIVFYIVFLGYTDLAVLLELLTRRDRSVPIRWNGGECRGYQVLLGLSFIAIFGWLALPFNAGTFLFFLLFYLLGVFGFLTYITANIEYRLPTRNGVEMPTVLDRPLFGRKVERHQASSGGSSVPPRVPK